MKASTWRSVALVSVAMMVMLSVHHAVAAIDRKPQVSGTGRPFLKVVGSHKTVTTSSTRWVDLHGASAQINVPEGEQWIVTARFTGEGICFNGGWDTIYCMARIVVDGAQAQPTTGRRFIFLPPDEGSALATTSSMDRFSGPLAPGTHTVEVQWLYVNPEGHPFHFELDSWVLTVDTATA